MFWLQPHPRDATPQRGSPVLFRVPFIEAHLSRVQPWQILALWVPVSLYCLARGGLDPALAWPEVAGLAVAGLGAWTLLEYVLHRFVFHHGFDHRSALQHDLAFLVHGIHHDYPWDADRLVMPPVLAVGIALAIGLPMRAVLGPHAFWPTFAGLIAGYLWYDLAHFAAHHHKPTTWLGKLQRRQHLLHHFQSPHARYGVTTPVWDHVFRTTGTPEPTGQPTAIPEP
jgi:sterol desaturase/sphingolipid hydroxylase (fatty acid hydroxylase superfamily)